MGLFGFTKVQFWQFFDLICYHSRHRKPCPRCDPSEATSMFGSTFGRICFSGTESRSARQTPSPLVPLSIAVLRPRAISVARSISINPQKCSGSSKNPLSHSLHIRYFAMKKLPGNPCFAPGVPHQLGRSSATSLLSAGENFHFSFFYFLPRGEGQSKKIEGATGV